MQIPEVPFVLGVLDAGALRSSVALSRRSSLTNGLVVASVPEVANRRLEPSFIVHGFARSTWSDDSLNSPAVSRANRLLA